CKKQLAPLILALEIGNSEQLEALALGSCLRMIFVRWGLGWRLPDFLSSATERARIPQAHEALAALGPEPAPNVSNWRTPCPLKQRPWMICFTIPSAISI